MSDLQTYCQLCWICDSIASDNLLKPNLRKVN